MAAQSGGSDRVGLYTGNDTGELYLWNDSDVLKVLLRSGNTSYINGGNVGIGTSTVPKKLTVAGEISGSDDLTISGDYINIKNTGQSGLRVYTNDTYANLVYDYAGNLRGRLMYEGTQANQAQKWTIYANNSEKMVISGSGEVGIGTNAPSYRLDVLQNAETNVVRFFNDGDDQNRDVMILQGGADAGPGNTRFITFADGNDGDFGFIQGPANNAKGGISFNTTADTSLLTLSGSNVGIGTVNPTFHSGGGLHISNATAARLHLTDSDAGEGTLDGMYVAQIGTEAFVYNFENDALIFGTNTSERMRILAGGNVGIGTATPGAALEVSSDTYPQLIIDGTDNSGHIGFQLSGSGARGGMKWNSTNNNVEFFGESGDRVRMSLMDSDDGYNLYISSSVMIPSGSVGIGTAVPTSPLHIKANVSNGPMITLDRTALSGVDDVAILGISNASGNADDFLWIGQSIDNKDFILQLDSGKVGIGTNKPDGLGHSLHIHSGSVGSVTAHASADDLIIESPVNAGMTIFSGTSGEGSIYFGDAGDNDIGRIRYNHSNNDMDFRTNTSTVLTLASNNRITMTGADGNQLTINDGGSTNSVIQFQQNDSAKAMVGWDNANDVLKLNGTTSAFANNNHLVISSSGKIGGNSGGHPNFAFHFSGSGISADGGTGGMIIETETYGQPVLKVLGTSGQTNDAFGLEVQAGDGTAWIARFADNHANERVRILGDGGITFNGDTATANALDDYEEGVHAVTLGGASFTMHSGKNSLQYTKVGRLVTLSGEISVTAVSSATGTFTISLPFTVADIDDLAERFQGTFSCQNINFAGNWINIGSYAGQDTMSCQITNDNGAWTYLQASTFSSTSEFVVSVQYIA